MARKVTPLTHAEAVYAIDRIIRKLRTTPKVKNKFKVVSHLKRALKELGGDEAVENLDNGWRRVKEPSAA